MMNKRELRVCYFGTYSMEEGYPRNRVIIEGLKKNGVNVTECHEDFWKDTSQKLEGVKAGRGLIKPLFRLLITYSKLISKFRQIGYYDALIVGYAGHIDIFLAKLLNLFRKKPVIFDAFLSLYDTAAMDRKIVHPRSFKAKLLKLIDTWSCRLADAVLLDTQAHVDYFVTEFGLPARKFYAVPVGSSLTEKIPLNPPLLKGEIWGLKGDRMNFNVLYFGSYIPLHGVDVILEAAKMLEDYENNPPTPPLEKGGRGGIVFTLIGTGQLLSEIKELASRLGLKNINFIDRFVSEDELTCYIMAADICLGVFGQTDKAARVIPCKVYNCLALGKPLITMLSPATEGVLTHRENVFFCRQGDPAALSEAILSLKNDEILRKKIAHGGQDYFENNFSVKAIGKTVLRLIESL